MAGVDENQGAADDDDDGCLEPGLDDVCGGHEWLAVYECGGGSAPAVRLLNRRRPYGELSRENGRTRKRKITRC